MSTKPGVTSRPSASIVRAAVASTLPTSVMTPSSIATSAVRAGAPVPSTTVPPRMTSGVPAHAVAPFCPARFPQGREQLAREQLLRRAPVLTVGPEARAGDDETFDPEIGEATQPLRAHVGRADDCEAVDELRLQRGRVRGGVAQVLVAVVAAADLRDDLTVGFGQPRAGRPGHRGEMRERRDRAADEVARGVEVGMAADVHVRAERDVGRDRVRRRPRPCAPGRSPRRRDRDRRRPRA